MAIFNEILSGRYNRALQKIFAIKGSAPVRQLGGEILPVHVFYNGVEHRAIEEWYRFGLAVTQAAVAASQSGVRFRNPPNSNRIVIFEKIAVSTTPAGVGVISLDTQTTAVDLAAVLASAPNMSWDKRLNQAPGVSISFAAPAAGLSLSRQLIDFPATPFTYDFIIEEQQEVILSPGEAIQLRNGNVNTNIDTTWWWRERKFEPEELNIG
jgi:hypothetical protein